MILKLIRLQKSIIETDFNRDTIPDYILDTRRLINIIFFLATVVQFHNFCCKYSSMVTNNKASSSLTFFLSAIKYISTYPKKRDKFQQGDKNIYFKRKIYVYINENIHHIIQTSEDKLKEKRALYKMHGRLPHIYLVLLLFIRLISFVGRYR